MDSIDKNIRPPHVRLGGIAAASVDPRNFQFRDSKIGGAVPPASTIPEKFLMPVMLQTNEDCGPCTLASCVYSAISRFVSPRFTYFLSRQKAGSLPGDVGTTAAMNMSIAANAGQADLAVWPYPGDINQAPTPPALTNALANTITYYACSDLPSIFAAIAANHPIHMHWQCTTEWYYPEKCADGSFEVLAPAPSSASIGGHFTVIDAYDSTRKCLDGTTGAVRVRNSWGTSWGANGLAWVSIAAWVNQRGDPGSRYVVSAKAPPSPAPSPPASPLTPTQEKPMTITTLSPASSVNVPVNSYSGIFGEQLEQIGGVWDLGFVSPNGAWVEFTLIVPVAGNYTITAPTAALVSGSLTVSVNGGATATVPVGGTGFWDKFSSSSATIALPAGTVTIRITPALGFQYNLRDLTVAPAPPTTITAQSPIIGFTVHHADGTDTTYKVQ